MSRTVVLALLTCVVVLAACGEDDDGASRAPGNGVDRAFVAGMVPHHEAAIDMGLLAERRGRRRIVRQLGSAIEHIQHEEVVVLEREDALLAAAGVKRGSLGVPAPAHGQDAVDLRRARGDAFDRTFLELMIPHHEGAVAMARAELAKGTDPELRDLAQRIVDAQGRELAVMRAELARLGDRG